VETSERIRQRGPRFEIGSYRWDDADEGPMGDFGTVLISGRLTEGPFVKALETELAGRQAHAVSSGAAALDIAMEIVAATREIRRRPGHGLPLGPRVHVSMAGHWTDRACIERVRGEIIWTPVTWDGQPRLDLLTEASLRYADAVLLVPIGGWFDKAAVSRLAADCQKSGTTLVVDASHAVGDPSVLEYGDIAVSSLFATKLVTSGEGGVIATSDSKADLVRSLRDGGRDPNAARTGREKWLHAGTDRRMPELSAALGLASLATLPERMTRRRAIAGRYAAALGKRPKLRIVDTSFGMYKFLVVAETPELAASVRAGLIAAGVEPASGVYEVPLNLQGGRDWPKPLSADPKVAELQDSGRLWAERHIALPFHETMPDDEVTEVAAALALAADQAGA